MSSSKHPKPGEQPVKLEDDLERNPGVGSSKGLFAREGGEEAELIEGDNSFEGDVDNDAGRAGGVSLKEGRRNK